MSTITVTSGLTTGFVPIFDLVQSIEVEDRLLGQGGFGVVHRASAFNGRPNASYVVKLLTDSTAGWAERGFDTIQELQRGLQREHRQLVASSGRTLSQAFPALAGVPQFSFTGRLQGRAVRGYVSENLVTAGMEDFGRLLEDDVKVRQFQSIPLSAKMLMAGQLVNAFAFLSQRLLFIHADIKSDALFVDVARGRCAIIDFDSGAVARDPSDKPTTFGTKQDWLAPEIVKQLDQPANSSRAIKVDLFSDMWSVAIAIHYLIFGFHPLFFLTEISERSIAAYFQRCQWPDVPARFEYFRRDYGQAHTEYTRYLRSIMPADLLRLFVHSINKGYGDPAARTTYGQWKTVLRGLNQPAIRRFEADRTFLTNSRRVRLSWDVTGAARLHLSGVGDVTGRTFVDLEATRDTALTLTLTPDTGRPLTQTVLVQVSKQAPAIKVFTADRTFLADATPALLKWDVAGAERLEIDAGVGSVTGRSQVAVSPRTSTTYTLVATSPFGVTTRTSVTITVSTAAPVIRRFTAAPRTLVKPSPVTMVWDVSPDAVAVEITGVGPVSPTGTTVVSPQRDTAYVLRATSHFGRTTEARLDIIVSKDPPCIEQFSVRPPFAREGAPIEVSWQVTGAETLHLAPIGPVASKGTQILVAPAVGRLELSAESYFGVAVSRRLVVGIIRPTALNRTSTRCLAPTRLSPRGTGLTGRQTALGTGSASTSTNGVDEI